VVLADGRVDAARVARARAVRKKADARLARGEGLVVAALVGGTGSGKSSLCNALAGSEVSPVGVRRPTTEVPRAVVGGDLGASGPLLDWLAVPQRHAGGEEVPDGLVLLDLPDHDSVAVGHRDTVDRLVERVDVLVWVVDPIKYAMRALHEGYLGRLATHAEVVLVVLNRVDELAEADRAAVEVDLRRLLDAEGLGKARVVLTSARSGEGVGELRRILAEEAAEHGAAARRLAGDLRATALDLLVDVGARDAGPLDAEGVVEALAGAAGVGGVAATAADESRAGALEGTRPIVSRAGTAIISRGPSVLRHLRGLLPGGPDAPSRASAHAASVGVRHAVVQVVDRCAEPLPAPWRGRLQQVVGADSGALARTVAAAVDRVPLRSPRRWWWPVLALVLSVLELAVLAGAVWLAGLAVLGYLQLLAPQPPLAVGRVPWPTALLLGGLALRLLGGVLRRRLAKGGAHRHRQRVARELLVAVQEVAAERVVAPLRAELAARDELRAHLASLQR
jgi:GTP-binding protein EngB required for normal cell division